jgi:hypothetical protein
MQNEKADMQFLINQKDFKISELDRIVLDMKNKIEKAMTKAYQPNATDISKALKKDQAENGLVRKQEFTLSRTIDNQNVDPNRMIDH